MVDTMGHSALWAVGRCSLGREMRSWFPGTAFGSDGAAVSV